MILFFLKVCDDRNLVVFNRILGFFGIGEDVFYFFCLGILNKDFFEFIFFFYDYDEFLLIVSIMEVIDRN